MNQTYADDTVCLLPHRYPMLLVDRIITCEPGKSLTALKNVTYNEPFFQGHFPGKPIMPGVLILEAMAQATGLLAFYSRDLKPQQAKAYYLVGVDKARFKRPVVPGDQLFLEVNLVRGIRGIFRFSAVAKVAGKTVASAEIMTTEADSNP
ncbi:MAG: 3-hydroxyacyl-ACP dehydratase FabZ [Gammaproteobacteria bacterium]